jgi:hypothetical protein
LRKGGRENEEVAEDPSVQHPSSREIPRSKHRLSEVGWRLRFGASLELVSLEFGA